MSRSLWTTRGWVLLGVAALALGTLSCRQSSVQTPLPKELTDILPLGEKRPLEVVLASPQGNLTQTQQVREVTVAFNQPMVPLRPIATEEISGPLSVEPSVPGRFRWKGTATLAYEAREPLPYATRFKVKVPKGTRSWSGQELAQDYAFEFVTPVAELLGSLPAHGNKVAEPKGPIFLHFNQPMDPQKAIPSLSLESGGKAIPFDVRTAQPEDGEGENKRSDSEGYGGDGVYFQSSWLPSKTGPNEQTLVVTPREPLPLASETTLTLKSGLRGKQGDIGLSQDVQLKFSTYGPLEYSGARQVDHQDPENGLALSFSNPVAFNELLKHVTIEPKVELPPASEDASYSDNNPNLYIPLKPQTLYTVTLSKDLKDVHGQALGKDEKLQFKTADYQPSLEMAEGLGQLEGKGPRKIPVGIRNVKSAQIQVTKLNRASLIELLSHSDWNYEPKVVPAGGPTRTAKLEPSSKSNQVEDRSIELPASDGSYIFLNVAPETPALRKRALILISDLGITAKSSPENCVFMVTRFSDGKAVAGAEIEVRDDKGAPLWSGKTESNGTVQSPGWAALKAKKKGKWDSAPTLFVFAKSGSDETFVRTQGGHTIEPNDLAYDWTQEARKVRAFAFSERGLYVPGDVVELKGSIREIQSSQWRLPDFKQIEFSVTDSRGGVIAKGPLEIDDFGSFHHTVSLQTSCPTGSYRVAYSLPETLAKEAGISRELTGALFRVETFRPAQFEVTVKADRPHYVMGDRAKAELKGWYLFGAPMNDAAVRWRATIQPAYLAPEGEQFSGFDFFAQNLGGDAPTDQSKLLAEGETRLDAQGLKSIDINLDNINYRGSAELVLEGTVSSAGRQQITGRTVTPLHRGEYLVGLRPASSVASAGQKTAVEVVAVTPDGKLSVGKRGKLELLRREWKSTRKAGVDGRYQWVTETKDESVTSQDFVSGSKATSYEFTAPKSGYYVVRASSEDSRKNKIVSETGFYASGADYVAWERREGDLIKLIPDKSGYKPGETAKVLVQNPYESATALVTLEREHVIERYVQELKGSTPTVEIPLRSQHLPNVYVSVLLVQGRIKDKGFGPDGDDLGKPSFKVGYCNLPVATTEKKLTVNLKSDREVYAPGDEVTVTVETKNAKGEPVAADLSLAAADQGVLSLIGYKTPDYFDTFYGSRPLGVATTDSRLDVIGQRVYGTKGARPGGGGGADDSHQGNRENFKYTAYWNPSVRTDEKGLKQIRFKLPDNLTTFRLMAVGQTRGSDFGSGESKFQVQKQLMLQPSLPSFARVGDDFSAGVVIHNNSKETLTTEVELNATNLPVVGETRQTVSVPAGKEREVLFHFKPEKVEVAELTFRGKSGSLQDAVSLKLPLQETLVTETVATSGTTTDPATVEMTVPGPIAPNSGRLELNLSASALVGLQGATLFNLDYQFNCLEQRLSRIHPLVSTQRLIQGMNLKGYSNSEIRKRVEQELPHLASYQDPGGGFRLWPDSRFHINDYITAYVLETLAGARDQGYKVDQQMINRAKTYLGKVLAGATQQKSLPYSLDERWVNRCYALYALSLWSGGDVSELNKMYGERAQMSITAKAYLLLAAQHLDASPTVVATLQQELKNAGHLESATLYFAEDKAARMPWTYASNELSTALVLRSLLEGKTRFDLAPRVVNWMMTSRGRSGYWGNTRTNCAVLDAFALYLEKFEADSPNFTARVKLGTREVFSQSFKGRDAAVQRAEVALPNQTEKLPLRFEKSGPGRLYYDVRMTYATAKEQPARDEGMAVFKTITDPTNGKKLAEFKAGSNYLVTLSVVTPKDRHYVVLQDPVPAGFEVVQTDFETESGEMRAILERANTKSPGFTFGHFEKYGDRVLLFADGLTAGEHTFRYLLRANQPGSFLMPSTKAEEMYHPEVFGITAPLKVTIR